MVIGIQFGDGGIPAITARPWPRGLRNGASVHAVGTPHQPVERPTDPLDRLVNRHAALHGLTAIGTPLAGVDDGKVSMAVSAPGKRGNPPKRKRGTR